MQLGQRRFQCHIHRRYQSAVTQCITAGVATHIDAAAQALGVIHCDDIALTGPFQSGKKFRLLGRVTGTKGLQNQAIEILFQQMLRQLQYLMM